MPDAAQTPMVFIPSKGLDLYHDSTVLPLEYAKLCLNLMVTSGVLNTRAGTAGYHAVATVGIPTDDLAGTINAFTIANYYDSAGTLTSVPLAVFNNAIQGLTVGSPGSWTHLTHTATDFPIVPITSAEQGTFVQFRNAMYYSAPHTPPVAVRKLGAIVSVHPAGVDNPCDIKMIDACDTPGDWVASGTGHVDAAGCYNTLRFVEGAGGVTFQTTNVASAPTYYLRTVAKDLTAFDNAEVSTPDDYISFYLYRTRKQDVKTLKLTFYNGTAFTVYAEATLVDQYTNTNSEPVRHPANNTPLVRTFIHDWDSEKYDFQVFKVKVRKRDFIITGAFDWSVVTSVMFTLVPATTPTKCAIIVDYLHLRRTEPVANTMGWKVLGCNPVEERAGAWTGTDSPVVFNNIPSSDGCALALTGVSAYATHTYTSAWNWDVLPDLTKLKGRDRLSVWMASKGGMFGQVKITITSGAFTANTIFYFLGGKSGVRKERPLWAFTYSDGKTFLDFPWTAINSVTITKGTNADNTVYVDNIVIKQAANSKTVFNFEALDVRAASAAGDALALMFAGFNMPRAADICKLIDDNYVKWKYHQKGNGSLLYPDTEFTEAGKLSTASMRITAGGNTSIDTQNTHDAEAEVVGDTYQVGDLFTEGDSASGGLMVWWRLPFFKPTAKIFGQLDLAHFYKLKIPTPSSTGSLALVEYTADIDDNDNMRIWVHIDKPQNLAQIVFRLYYDESKGATEPSDSDWFDLPVFGAEGHYVEYTFDAAQLNDKNASSSMNWANVQQYLTQDSEKVNVPLPWGGSGDIDTNKILTELGANEQTSTYIKNTFGIDIKDQDFTVPQYTDTGMSTVLTWKRGDMVLMQNAALTTAESNFSDEDAAVDMQTDVWPYIKGYSIRVIPVSGKAVSVSFDNWEIHSADPTDGTYYYKCTYVDSFGNESASSDASPACVAKGKKIYVSSIPRPYLAGAPTSTNIEAINLYRIGGSNPEWRLVSTLDTDTLTYIDEKGDDELGRLMPEDAYAPPACQTMTLINNSMFYGNCTDRFSMKRNCRVMHSEPFYPGRVPDENAIDVRPEDGQYITAITALQGYPIVLKSGSVFTLDPNNLLPIPKDNSVGCIATHSVATDSTHVYFLSRQGVRRFDMQQVDREIGKPIDTYFEGIAISTLKNAVGFIHKNTYWVFLPSTAGIGFALDIPTGIWTQHKIGSRAAAGVAAAYGQVTCAHVVTNSVPVYNVVPVEETDLVYLGTSVTGTEPTMRHRLIQFLTGDTDYDIHLNTTGTVPIDWVYQTGDYDFGAPANEKRLTEIFVRAKLLLATSTYTIDPYVEQVRATYGGPTSYLRISSGDLATNYITKRFVASQGAHGYIHSLYLTGTGRVGLSKVSATYTTMVNR